MHKDFVLPISIEEFAAYLDGNLSAAGMNRVAEIVSNNSDMEEIVSISDAVDEDMLAYMQDEFAYEADITALENSDYDIPNLDTDISSHLEDDNLEYKEDVCTAYATDEISESVEPTTFNNGKETEEEILDDDNLQSLHNEDSDRTCIDDVESDSTDTPDISCVDDFFNSWC